MIALLFVAFEGGSDRIGKLIKVSVKQVQYQVAVFAVAVTREGNESLLLGIRSLRERFLRFLRKIGETLSLFYLNFHVAVGTKGDSQHTEAFHHLELRVDEIASLGFAEIAEHAIQFARVGGETLLFDGGIQVREVHAMAV